MGLFEEREVRAIYRGGSHGLLCGDRGNFTVFPDLQRRLGPCFFTTLSHILRPIFMGMILAFLLLPIQRHILQFMLAMTPNQKLKNKNDVRFLSIISIVLSLLVAFILLYLLLAMVIPQVYDSIVGLVMAFPEYIESAQVWLLTFLEDNPEIQSRYHAYL